MKVEVITNSSASIIVNKDTLKNTNNRTLIEVRRQSSPLSIVAYNDTIRKNLTIDYKNSLAYWANLGFFYGAGMLLDMDNPKRYAYPKTIYLNMNNNDNTYTTLSNMGVKNKFLLKINPFKLIDVSNPGLELSGEKGTGNRFATQVMASYLFPARITDSGNDFRPNIKGCRVALEEKYYLKKQAPVGSYVSLELNYMKNQYTDISTFGSSRFFIFSPYDRSNTKDTIGIKKQTFSVNFKYGHQLVFNKLSIDLYAGLGARFKDVRFFDGFNPDRERKSTTRPIIYVNREGKYWIINIPIGFRLAYII